MKIGDKVKWDKVSGGFSGNAEQWLLTRDTHTVTDVRGEGGYDPEIQLEGAPGDNWWWSDSKFNRLPSKPVLYKDLVT